MVQMPVFVSVSVAYYPMPLQVESVLTLRSRNVNKAIIKFLLAGNCELFIFIP